MKRKEAPWSCPGEAVRVSCLSLLAPVVAAAGAAQTGTAFVEGGSVGIGTPTSSQLLHVESSMADNALVFVENSSGPESVGSR